jgi:RimJ/RimL family protein N-acetyltransferase
MAEQAATKPVRPYVLRGELVGLKALHKEDAAVATPLFQNLEMITYLSLRGRVETVESEGEWFDRALKGAEDQVHFSIFEIAADRYIGGCGLFQIRPMNCAMMGICIADPSVWNKGYGTEATRLLVEYGMFFLNLFNIRLGVYSYNERARRAYLRAGFRDAGRIRGTIVVGGERYDEILMDITRDEVDLSRMRKMVPLIEGTKR